MNKIIKLIIFIIIILAVAGGAWYYVNNVNKNFTVTGVVVDNINEMATDGPAYLIIRLDDGTQLTVYYNHSGESLNGLATCQNEKAAKQAASIKPDQRVEVLGQGTSEQYLDTCDSPDFYIKPIE